MALFASDEAQCRAPWGHDFRREYRELTLLHERWPDIPRIALTATADPPTQREIAERLQLENAHRFTSSFDRPNIRHTVVQKDNGSAQLRDFLETHSGEAGIVYFLSPKQVEQDPAAPAHTGQPAP